MLCYYLFITCLLQCSRLFDPAVSFNLSLDVMFFFNILLLGDLILHVWRGDRRDLAAVESKNGPSTSAPTSPWKNITIRLSALFLAPPVTLAPSIRAKSFSHAGIVLSERRSCDTDAGLRKSDPVRSSTSVQNRSISHFIRQKRLMQVFLACK